MNPTSETYETLNKAYEFFNKELFDGKLPTCLITMQRHAKTLGYFVPERFTTRKEENSYVHEIALNPATFINRTDEEIMSTLVHEMCHLWQQEFGTPPRRNYHNREWSAKMETLGLIPSNTGVEGGAKTGQSMTHYIEDGGKFSGLIEVFFSNNARLGYADRPIIKVAVAKAKNKVKYTCPDCRLNAWGKPGIEIMCGRDKKIMISEDE